MKAAQLTYEFPQYVDIFLVQQKLFSADYADILQLAINIFTFN